MREGGGREEERGMRSNAFPTQYYTDDNDECMLTCQCVSRTLLQWSQNSLDSAQLNLHQQSTYVAGIHTITCTNQP